MSMQGTGMDNFFSSCEYEVRKLQPGDADKIYALCGSNPQFYEFHPPFVTRESILEDMTALPPGKTGEDKYFVGFWQGEMLAAILDLIVNYPHTGVAFIGLFMTDAACQKQGIGSKIIQELASALAAGGFAKIRLAIDEGNPQSEAFWLKNDFRKTGESYPAETSVYIPMERLLRQDR